MTVKSVASLPQALTPTTTPAYSPSFTVVIDSEHMLVTPIAGTNNFTIVRGVDGTTATTHAVGAKVTLLDPATEMQTVLRALGGPLADVVVKGIDSEHYQICFGDASGELVQPQVGVNYSTMTFSSGFLPAITMSTVSEPITIANIPISPTNPSDTITAIQDAFLQLAQNYYVSPIDSTQMPYDKGPPTTRIATPTVLVTSVPTAADPQGLLTFNIEFTGDSGMSDQPLLVIPANSVLSAPDKNGNTTVLNTSAVSAVTIKEPSDEFRVNPDEPDNPFTPYPNVFNQTNPAVAMDAQGDFVITWQSEIPDEELAGSVSDIFARMYKPVGFVDPGDPGVMKVDMNDDGVPDTVIQGVRLVESPIPYEAELPADSHYRVASDLYTFRVNEITANAQGDPSIGMDVNGDFVIAWSSAGQPVSFFNDVYKREFTRDGTPMTAVEEIVNSEDTENHGDSYVAMSRDGHCVILWDDSSGLELAIYDVSGALLDSYLLVPGANGGTAAFDTNNDFTVGFTVQANVNYNGAATSAGYYFGELDLQGDLLRGLTRANQRQFRSLQ